MGIRKRTKKSLRILITAGSTIEPIDPVRFISNRSTGYMGYKLADAAKKRRFKVTLLSGASGIKPPKGIHFLRVETAREMNAYVHRELAKNDVLIMASAVSDFRPAAFSRQKVKSQKRLVLKLIRNPDILKSLTRKERKNKVIVGFALETGNLLGNAIRKLRMKRLDLLIANKIDKNNDPFGEGKKTVYLLDKFGRRKKLEKITKACMAPAILDTIEELCYTPV